jgi:hypothetical protein
MNKRSENGLVIWNSDVYIVTNEMIGDIICDNNPPLIC